jgi:hypothetical protein
MSFLCQVLCQILCQVYVIHSERERWFGQKVFEILISGFKVIDLRF